MPFTFELFLFFASLGFCLGGGSVAMNSDIISLKCNTPWTTSDDWKRRVSNRISDDLVTEWQEFFTPAIFKSVYSLYIVMLGKYDT